MNTGKVSEDYHLYKRQRDEAEAKLERLKIITQGAVFMMRRAGYGPVNQSNNPIEAWLFDAERELKNQKGQ